MANVARLLGDSWALLILREIFYGVTRFDDLKRELGISSATLSKRIGELVKLDILMRSQYREEGARARPQYLLTDKGQAFGKVLWAMMEWSDEYLGNGETPIELTDPKTHKPLRLALVDDEGRRTAWRDAVPRVALPDQRQDTPLGKPR